MSMSQEMKCGHCGNCLFKISLAEGDQSFPTQLIVECSQCKNTSTLTPTQPTIEIGWGENSEGILYVS